MSTPSNITELMKILQLEALNVEKRSSSKHDDREPLSSLFREALDKTIDELNAGADVHEFYNLGLANFFILAVQEGYSTMEIKVFSEKLRPTER